MGAVFSYSVQRKPWREHTARFQSLMGAVFSYSFWIGRWRAPISRFNP